MTIDCKQLRELVIRPAISAIGMWSKDAEELLLLTAATESHLGSYIRQVGIVGEFGAFGIYQMEKRTYQDLWDRLIQKNVALRAKIRLYCGYEGRPPVQRLMTDLALATIMSRLHYRAIQKPLPSYLNELEMAEYWKKYYNSLIGKGTVEKAVEDYRRYCK